MEVEGGRGGVGCVYEDAEQGEAIFLHFELEDEERDFFTVSHFVFPDYDDIVKYNR